MNKVFIIAYDLRQAGQNYTSLYDNIKALTTDWQHPLESIWFVRVADNLYAQNIFDVLKPTLDDNDSLFIMDINNASDKQGWMPKTFWTWLG